MPAATENTKPYVDYWGRTPVVMIDLTWNDADTYTAVDIGAIAWAEFTPTTNASCGITVATNVVTFHSGGALTGKLAIYGNGQ